MITLSSRADLTLEAARLRLRPPGRKDATLPTLGAAALAAASALALAAAVILGAPGGGQAQAADAVAVSR